MKKLATGSIQYLPYIIVPRERIPPVELKGSLYNTLDDVKTDLSTDGLSSN